MDIDNDDMLEMILLNEINIATKKAAETVLYEVKKNIDEVVYEPYSGQQHSYRPLRENGGFYGSWIVERLMLDNMRSSSYEIRSEPMLMVRDFPYHEGRNGEDRTSIMSESIIRGINWDFSYQDKSKKGTEWWHKRRDFWTPTINVLKDDFLGRSVSQELTRSGGWDVLASV